MVENLITVVMPTYNDEKYIVRAIDDILNQTYKNFEFIIVNDGSTDNTKQILSQYEKKDTRIKVFHKENGGTGSALNVGFSKAKGEFGTWVSSDDTKEPTYLEDLVTFLIKNRDIESVCSAFFSKYLNKTVRAYVKQSEHIIPLNISQQDKHDGKCSGEWFIVDNWANLNAQSCMLGVCFMFTMKLKNRVGEYINIPGEDYYMTMRMALNSRSAYLDKNLGTHNNPPDSLSMVDRSCVGNANVLTRNLYLQADKWRFFRIPKIANFYWGSKKMSFLRYLTIYSFKKLNPDWSIHLYVPKNISENNTWKAKGGDNLHKIDNLQYDGEDYFESLLKDVAVKIIKVNFSKTFLTSEAPEPHKSDLLTWQVLSSKGGLWCDMDIIFRKPLTDLNINKRPDVNALSDTLVCYDYRLKEADGSPTKPIGFLMSAKNNRFYKKHVIESAKTYKDHQYQSIGTYVVKRVSNSLEDCSRKFPKNKFTNIDPSSVYHFHFQKLDEIYDKNVDTPDQCIGIHWYGGHPKSQEFNKTLTDKNYKTFDNTICKVIGEVLNE